MVACRWYYFGNTDWNQRTSYYLLSIYATPRSPYNIRINLFKSILLQITTVTARRIRTREKNATKFRYRASCAVYGIENYEQFNLPVEAGVRRIYCLAESTLLQPTSKRHVICRKTYSSLSVVATPHSEAVRGFACIRIYPFVQDGNEGDCSCRLNP